MNKLRSVIIGGGAISPMHAASILNNKHAELVAVCDIKEDVAKKRASEWSCDFYTDYKIMIEELKPDCVHICLPHYLHAPVSIYALEQGCNVICEKPMATTVSDAEAMMNAAKKSGKVFEIIFQNRYNRASMLIHDTIEKGELGEVLGARANLCWHRDDEYYSESDWRGVIATEGGGVCVNQAIHTLDLMLWFFSKKPSEVVANIATFKHDIEVEDEANGIITFDDGTYANFWFSNNFHTDAAVSIEVRCEKGIVRLEADRGTITFADGRVITAQNSDEDFAEYGCAKGYWGIGHYKQISDFYNCIVNGEAMLLDYNDAFETHKVMCAILKSGREHKTVKID